MEERAVASGVDSASGAATEGEGAATLMLTTARAIVDIGLELVRADPGAPLTAASQAYLGAWLPPAVARSGS